MGVQFTPVAVPILVTAVLCAGTAVTIWTNLVDSESGSTLANANQAQTLVLSLISMWALGQLITVSTTTLLPKAFGTYLTLTATIWTAGSWLVFALYYTGREQWVDWRTAPLMLVVPVAGTVLVATDGFHHLMLVNPSVQVEGTRRVLAFEWGIGTWVGATYNWITGGVAVSLLLRKFLTSRNVYRKISFFHVVGGVLLLGSAFVSMIGESPFRYLVLGSVVFAAVMAVSAPAVVSYRYVQLFPLERLLSVFGDRFRNLTPMARDTILQEMQSGVVVLDHDNRIVDLNPLGRKMIAAEDRRVVGKPMEEVVPPSIFKTDDASFVDDPTVEGEFRGVWVETPGAVQRCFDVVITRLGSDDDPAGRVALINDVTDREIRKEKLEQRTQELERQNEQLDQFAGIVSHDLRNPLTVAEGYLETAEAVDDDEQYLEEAEQSLDRMEAIIDDVLTLAREGRSIGETERVDLTTTAREAWENVETERADLVVENTSTFDADPDRLLNLFENLFRNAREHAGSDVTVSVGWDDDGFYVADDGPGIPEDERDEVLEFGYTTAETGTGFGLAIVRQVADAHGWQVALTRSESGGARFEFRNVAENGTRMYT